MISLTNGGIILHIQGIILAGGKSSRMGTNKALLTLNNKKVIEHIIEEMKQITDDIIIIANEPELYQKYNIPIFEDRYMHSGPLAGLETALFHMAGDIAVVTPCDTPFVHHSVYNKLLHQMHTQDAIVPKYENRLHPLAGVYKKTVHSFIEQKIKNNELRMTSFYDDINVHIQEDFDEIDQSVLRKHFFNMNTVEDFNKAKEL